MGKKRQTKDGTGSKDSQNQKARKPRETSSSRLGKADYTEQLEPLQLELNQVARWLQHTGKRLLVVIEGRDTAGKGGVISAIADTLNPRQCRTVALPKPTERAHAVVLSALCAAPAGRGRDRAL
jgi:polyphosphate kinase 2 (PPK2 family)